VSTAQSISVGSLSVQPFCFVVIVLLLANYILSVVVNPGLSSSYLCPELTTMSSEAKIGSQEGRITKWRAKNINIIILNILIIRYHYFWSHFRLGVLI